jgi:hypothetical protein
VTPKSLDEGDAADNHVMQPKKKCGNHGATMSKKKSTTRTTTAAARCLAVGVAPTARAVIHTENSIVKRKSFFLRDMSWLAIETKRRINKGKFSAL